MTTELLLGFTVAGTFVLYALFGGADFGGGVWDLLASGPRKAEQRSLIARALGPVWEVNHVWLIVGLVLLFAVSVGDCVLIGLLVGSSVGSELNVGWVDRVGTGEGNLSLLT